MRRGLAAAVLVAMVAVGCDDGEGVVEYATEAAPYGGPPHVPASNHDGDGPQALRGEAGAAGRALECDGEIYSADRGFEWGEGDGGATPEEGLKLYFDLQQPEEPRQGYRLERREGDRALFSFDVDGRTKVAVVVAKDRPHRPGWGPETQASCDPAELPARLTDSGPYEIWTDRDGRRVPVARLTSYAGAAHCGWESVHFLGTGRYEDSRLYVRDPDGVLDKALLTAPYDGDATLPDDAHDTGYRFGDQGLWLADDLSTAYVRTPDGVEAWPRAKDGLGCK